jgi:hydrogenase maturation protease
VIDGGTGGIMLGGYISSCEHLMIIDSIILEGEKPGTIHIFDYDGFKAKKISSHFSPHQIGIMEAIELAGITDSIPRTISFFCVVPKKTEFSIGLTPEIQPMVKEVSEKILKKISDSHNIKIV